MTFLYNNYYILYHLDQHKKFLDSNYYYVHLESRVDYSVSDSQTQAYRSRYTANSFEQYQQHKRVRNRRDPPMETVILLQEFSL